MASETTPAADTARDLAAAAKAFSAALGAFLADQWTLAWHPATPPGQLFGGRVRGPHPRCVHKGRHCGRPLMPDLFEAGDCGRDRLRVSGRHIKPCTDELLVTVGDSGYSGYRRAAVLSRPQVRDLHRVLGDWLAEGWPGVPMREL